MAAPSVRAVGTLATRSGAGNISPGNPTHAAGDILVAFFECAGSDVMTADWGEVPDSPQSQGSTGTQLAVFWKRATSSSEADIVATLGGGNNHAVGITLSIQGCIASGDPWDVTAGGLTSAGANQTIGGDTTTVADTLVLIGLSTNNNATASDLFSNWTNANLASITEHADQSHTVAGGGGWGIITGVKASAGDIGNTTVDCVITSLGGWVLMALKPPDPVEVTPSTGTLTLTGFAPSVTLTQPFRFLAAGTSSYANNSEPTPGMPAGMTEGDLMVLVYTCRFSPAFLQTPSGWTSNLSDTSGDARLQIFTRVYQTGDTAPTLVYGDGNTGKNFARIFAYTHDAGVPLGLRTMGTVFGTTVNQQNIGAITGFDAIAGEIVIAVGVKRDLWTSVATLSGDGLTWSERWEEDTNDASNDIGIVVDDCDQIASDLTVTSKTFTVSGGSTHDVKGVMFTIGPVANVTPGTGTLTLTGFPPTVDVTTGTNVIPGLGSIVLTGFAPTVSATAHVNLTPGLASLVVTGFAPTASIGTRVTPTTGTLTLSGFSPTVTVSENVLVTPGVGAIIITGFAPTSAITEPFIPQIHVF